MTKGYYGGGAFGFPFGLGVGVYLDSHGRLYPQLYGGTPKLGFSGGYTPDLEGLLTGPSISVSPGVGPVRFSVAGNADTIGVGIGMPGVGVTHGYGPLEMANDYSRPWMTPSIRDSAARNGVPGRFNVFEYGYPDPNMASSLRDAQAGSNDSQFADNRLGRGTSSPAQKSAFDGDTPAVLAPMQPPGPISLNDAYLEYLKRLNAYQTQASPFDGGMRAAPPVSADDSKFSGGHLGRLTALMGVDPQNPEQLAPPPQDDDLRGFYRDDPLQPWFPGR